MAHIFNQCSVTLHLCPANVQTAERAIKWTYKAYGAIIGVSVNSYGPIKDVKAKGCECGCGSMNSDLSIKLNEHNGCAVGVFLAAELSS